MSVSASVMIGGASADHSRNEADFYPTPPECTEALLDACGHLFRGRVWEPACGDGAISKVLVAAGMAVYSSDLRHSGFGVGGIDFLATSITPLGGIITNPPFNLAEAFIRHACSFGVPVAMLLKATYWHAASRQALFHDTGPRAVLPMLWRPNFAPDRGKSPTMDVCWTVWGSEPSGSCDYRPLPKPQKGVFG
jgi:hypothetical protein